MGRALRRHTLWNVTVGWWGAISCVATLFFLVVNVIAWADARRRLALAAAEEDARRRARGEGGEGGRPALARGTLGPFPVAQARELAPFWHNVRLRLRAGERAEEIGRDLARVHGVAEPDALRFVRAVRGAAAA